MLFLFLLLHECVCVCVCVCVREREKEKWPLNAASRRTLRRGVFSHSAAHWTAPRRRHTLLTAPLHCLPLAGRRNRKTGRRQ